MNRKEIEKMLDGIDDKFIAEAANKSGNTSKYKSTKNFTTTPGKFKSRTKKLFFFAAATEKFFRRKRCFAFLT